MTAQLIQEMDTPPRYKPPQEIVAEWMIYYRNHDHQWPSITQLSELSGVSRSTAARLRREYIRAHEKRSVPK